MKRSTKSLVKTASNLSESVHQQLSIYALAAGAAGLSVLALPQSSEGKIVYTPANVQLTAGRQYNLDLNHDGITDFTIYDTQNHYRECEGYQNVASLFVTHPQANGAVGRVQHFAPRAAALDRNVKIGPQQSFLSGSERDFMAVVLQGYGRDCRPASSIFGPWANVTNRYLGLKFMVNGKTHYGWARLSVQAGFLYVNATLTGFAFETIAGKSIKAGQEKGVADENFGSDVSLASPISDTPQPATLGALALGAPGLSIWRRKESVA